MKKEKIVISFFAVLLGVIASAVAFYVYQTTKEIKSEDSKIVSLSPSPVEITKAPSVFLTVQNPKDEEVVASRTITVSGKTTSDAVVIISTQSKDEVVTPSSNGTFTTTLIIDLGQNVIEIIAIAPNGEEAKVTKVITSSNESF